MNVLVTGAFGNVGGHTVRELLAQGHRVRCFGTRRPKHERTASALGGQAEIAWGDIRLPNDVAAAVTGQDAVVHLAFITPPRTETQPEMAFAVNVGGTRNLLEAIHTVAGQSKLVFMSSVVVFGLSKSDALPCRSSDPTEATNRYSHHKIECERMIRESGLDWSILRLGACVPLNPQGIEAAMFHIPLDSRVEFIDPRDTALAVANLLSCPQAWGRVLLLGGGSRCWMTHGSLLRQIMETSGIGKLPDSAFSEVPFPTTWMDTAESERLLHYQRHTFEDYLRDNAAALKPLEPVMAR